MSDIGHNSQSGEPIAADLLKSLVDRVERLEAEIAEMNSDKSESTKKPSRTASTSKSCARSSPCAARIRLKGTRRTPSSTPISPPSARPDPAGPTVDTSATSTPTPTPSLVSTPPHDLPLFAERGGSTKVPVAGLVWPLSLAAQPHLRAIALARRERLARMSAQNAPSPSSSPRRPHCQSRPRGNSSSRVRARKQPAPAAPTPSRCALPRLRSRFSCFVWAFGQRPLRARWRYRAPMSTT
jgi:hypothetical protein